MEKSLRRTGLHWRVVTLPNPWRRRIIGGAVVAIAAPLALLTLMGNRPADPRESMRAEIGRLEEQISTNAADVASLRMMADQARAELATLHSQKQAEEASLVTASHAVSAPEAGPALPGADWPFYNPPLRTPRPPVHEVIVSAPRHLHLHTARDYLLAARQHVARGRSGDAQTALEKAETRALNNSSWRDQDLRHSQLIRQIGDARRLLAGGDGARTAQAIDAAAQSAR